MKTKTNLRKMILCAFLCMAQPALAPTPTPTPTKEDFCISEPVYSTDQPGHEVITVIHLGRGRLTAHFQFEGKISKDEALKKINFSFLREAFDNDKEIFPWDDEQLRIISPRAISMSIDCF